MAYRYILSAIRYTSRSSDAIINGINLACSGNSKRESADRVKLAAGACRPHAPRVTAGLGFALDVAREANETATHDLVRTRHALDAFGNTGPLAGRHRTGTRQASDHAQRPSAFGSSTRQNP